MTTAAKADIMLIRLSDQARVQQLFLFLARDHDALVNTVADDELEVAFVGSFNTWAQQKETETRVRLWMASNPDAIVALSS